MKITILGAAGFIGTNLALHLACDMNNEIKLVDQRIDFFQPELRQKYSNVCCLEADLTNDNCFDNLLAGQDIVYHLFSSSMPTNSNLLIPQELEANVVLTSYLLESCVRCHVKKIVFMSSGGTVYGNSVECPINEEAPTFPITSYGLQKITIEKLLSLYNYMHGLDYRIVRLSNPYGPYQRPNGKLGAITTFVYKAIHGEEITVYGDGSVVRDFIYIDDAIKGIVNIADGETQYQTFNLGCGRGTSINQVLTVIGDVLGLKLNVRFSESRSVDVSKNYLDITRYESAFGKLSPVSLEEGIKKTAAFLEQFCSGDSKQ